MEKYKNLQKLIGIKFKNAKLLDRIFMHRSYINEHKRERLESNERLEFLGDAVLELVVTEFIYNAYPDKSEGELTDWRSALVNGPHLAEIARTLNLNDYLYLSKGERMSGGNNKPYILANTLEALIGGIYVDQGYKKSHEFIKKFILKRLTEIIEKGLHIDSKSLFQEIAQGKELFTPIYKVLEESGPDHARHFKVGLYIRDKLIAEGSGPSKQKAEQSAAKEGLKVKRWG